MTLKDPDVMSSARINQHGRIVIPAECRTAAGLKSGDELIVEVAGAGEIRIRTKERAIKEAQTIVSRYSPRGCDLVQELIEERRAQAARQ